MDAFGGLWTNYVEKLNEFWRYCVRDEDTVVLVGDTSWAMTLDEAKADFEFLNALPGKKIILKGNHDFWWQTMSKLDKFIEENNFDTVTFLHNGAVEAENKIICGSRGWICDPSGNDKKILQRENIRFNLSIDAAEAIRGDSDKEIIAFSHYPLILRGMETSPILETLVRRRIKRCYYGHLHNVSEDKLVHQAGGVSLELVSSDFVYFTPVRIN